MEEYTLGERVTLTDKNQRDIIGVVIDRKKFQDRVLLLLDLEDEGGTYVAHILNPDFRSTPETKGV